MLKSVDFLKVNANQIIDKSGNAVKLHGVGLGGWMNMENFITGFPANEDAFRSIVYQALGNEKADFFFERYLEYFFTNQDACFIKSLGLNTLRVPFNYHHFEDDMQPMEIREEGLKSLERVVDICAAHGIYTILDLHAAAGYQNQDWHSDNPSQKALFWQHKHFQDRTVWLWEVIARRFKDKPWVAGYNVLNEPSDPTGERLDAFYRRVAAAIRKIDPDHILFLDGNRYSQDFSAFGEPLPNAVYALHNYATPGFIDGGDYPGISRGNYIDREVVRQNLLKECSYMLENNVPIWVGEFGPVYTSNPEKDSMRYQLLEDQLSFYRTLNANWSLWTYKDLGLQGLVTLRPDSKWVKRIKPILDKKTLLGVDSWGGRDSNVRHIMEPIEQTFNEFFPNYKPFPFDAQWQINRSVRHILLAEPLIEDFYPLLKGSETTEIDVLMQSFLFQNCRPRKELVEIILREQGIPEDRLEQPPDVTSA
jgi:endoglucanase